MKPIVDKFNRQIKDLRISITDKCNFRCPYCMPADVYKKDYRFLTHSQLLRYEEIERIARIFTGLGVRKIRITGGEPLLRVGIENLVGLLSEIEDLEDLTLTTNGYLLKKKAKSLRDAGLKRLTVSLDSLDDEVFKKLNGTEFSVNKVLDGIYEAEICGFKPIKINVVVQRGINDESIQEMIGFFKERGHIIRFIEYMDVGNINNWKPEDVFSAEEIRQRIEDRFPIEPADPGGEGGVAERYLLKDGTGEIGIIASITRPFCIGCTRMRLSLDGRLYTCLFAQKGTDLKGPLRASASDEEIMDIIRNIWKVREDHYSELRAEILKKGFSKNKIEMFRIGG